LIEGQRVFAQGLVNPHSQDIFVLPLYFAVINRHWIFVDFLIANGADINNEKDYHNISLLHYASEAGGATDVVLNLIKRGGNSFCIISLFMKWM
jgi:ankyrin repeat protein